MPRELEERIRHVMRLVIGDGVAERGDVVRHETEGWDSLTHVELVFTLEDEFDVSLSEAELAELGTLHDLCAAVLRASTP